MSEMSHEDAVAALSAAAAVDPMVGGTPAAEQAAPAPVVSPAGEVPATPEQPTPVAPVAPVVPQGQEAPAAPEPVSEPQFFNPDTLDPALLPGWKQLQGAFTQRMQEVAEERRQLAQYGDTEQIAEAVELYSRISDPANWPQLHTELAEAMVEAGLTPQQANALAAEELQAQAQAPSPLEGLDLSDPDIAPLAEALKAQAAQQARLEAQVAALTADHDLQTQFAAEEQAQQQRTQHLQSQLQAIQAARPDYDQADMREIIERAPFYNDDLIAAQAAYEAGVARRLDRYYAGKQAAAAASLQPPSGAGASSHVDGTPATLDDAAAEAIEYVRGLQAAGEFDS